jgi:pSer/pThr/pTyr-binding forkhead associated (FHA) protein
MVASLDDSGLAGMRQPGDIMRLRAAEAAGVPFLLLRDGDEAQQIHALTGERVEIGRALDNGLVIAWDELISRSHAALEHLGGVWSLVDDGRSRNGTFVNGERIHGRRRLHDRDVIRVGRTLIVFRSPSAEPVASTAVEGSPETPYVSPAQRRVLVALCRPSIEAGRLQPPPSNQQLATQLHLSLDAVKTHLRLLFGRFGLEGLAQNEKRMRLVASALETGVVGRQDLAGERRGQGV